MDSAAADSSESRAKTTSSASTDGIADVEDVSTKRADVEDVSTKRADVEKTGVTGSRSPVVHGLRLAVAVGIAVVIVDQITKWLALRNLTFGTPSPVAWTLDWNLVYNTGSAFSLGTGFGAVLGVVSLAIVGAVLFMAARTTRRHIAFLLGGVAGGAIGNVLDRVFRVGDCAVGDCTGFMGGAVVDFIDLNWWPVFNVADMFVVVGALSLAAFGLFDEDAFGPRSDS